MPHNALLQELVGTRLASRIARRDPAAFAKPGQAAADPSVANRLGWIDTASNMLAHIPEIELFTEQTRQDGLTTIYLLGMGGSSLCAEVLRDVPQPRTWQSRFVVLDTTDERTIRTVTDELDPAHALFIVASKSGSTIEVRSLERHFWSVMSGAVADAGRHFVAITDPDTALARESAEKNYRHTFVNPADIGGRFSALSLFGLVPASLVGLNVRSLVESAVGMAESCQADASENPGLALGAFMAAHAIEGRDKLTVLVPESLGPLGVWIEQLVAESTGKDGKGVLPVVNEPLGKPTDYNDDRAFVAVLTPAAGDLRSAARRLESAGHPVFRIEAAPAGLGAEFYRWEFATAVAGAALGVNPFDEPNVRDAKQRTQEQLDARRATGTFRIEPALTRGPGYSRREYQPERDTPRRPYWALLDYLPAESRRPEVIDRLRAALRQRSKVATTHGIGPRYLHSTGQYHKGGPNTGLFLLITAADASATPIPGEDYTFSVLKQAQALGDFEALVAAGREVIHYHIDDASADFSAELEKVVLSLT